MKSYSVPFQEHRKVQGSLHRKVQLDYNFLGEKSTVRSAFKGKNPQEYLD